MNELVANELFGGQYRLPWRRGRSATVPPGHHGSSALRQPQIDASVATLADQPFFGQRSDHLVGMHRPERQARSEEHTSELQSLMRISYAVFCLQKKNQKYT